MTGFPSQSFSPIQACALGPISYRDGLRLQEALVAARAAERDRGESDAADWLLFPEHPPVLTVGRNPSPGNVRVPRSRLEELGIELFEVARGGDITWHGPGQLVCYAVCDLAARGRDLHRFLRELEEGLIRTLDAFGIQGERVPGRTGVWVDGEKIASIGVAVRRWVSYHGIALNVRPDLSFFDLIHPCGLNGIRMTSLASRIQDSAPDLETVRLVTAAKMAETMGYGTPRWVAAADAWRAATSPEPGAGDVTAAVHSMEPESVARATDAPAVPMSREDAGTEAA